MEFIKQSVYLFPPPVFASGIDVTFSQYACLSIGLWFKVWTSSSLAFLTWKLVETWLEDVFQEHLKVQWKYWKP